MKDISNYISEDAFNDHVWDYASSFLVKNFAYLM